MEKKTKSNRKLLFLFAILFRNGQTKELTIYGFPTYTFVLFVPVMDQS